MNGVIFSTVNKNSKSVKDIRQRYNGPIVGIIGSTSPSYGYVPALGTMVGFNVCKVLSKYENSAIFTGGVEGVGLDAYTGISMYRIANKDSMCKFFTLIPDTTKRRILNTKEYEDVPYDLPYEYSMVSRFAEMNGVKDTLSIVRAGHGMAERRDYVGAIPDVVILMNGSNGSMAEALCTLDNDIPLLVLPSSGSSEMIRCIKEKTKFYSYSREEIEEFKILKTRYDNTNQYRLLIDKAIILKGMDDIETAIDKLLKK